MAGFWGVDVERAVPGVVSMSRRGLVDLLLLVRRSEGTGEERKASMRSVSGTGSMVGVGGQHVAVERDVCSLYARSRVSSVVVVVPGRPRREEGNAAKWQGATTRTGPF